MRGTGTGGECGGGGSGGECVVVGVESGVRAAAVQDVGVLPDVWRRLGVLECGGDDTAYGA
jgi:hypothetical protein